jgi:hypothetical protein
MNLRTLLIPTTSSTIAFIFVVFAFVIGFRINTCSQTETKPDQPKTEAVKPIPATLLNVLLGLVSYGVVSAVVNATIQKEAEEKADKGASEKFHKEKEIFENQFLEFAKSEIERLLLELELDERERNRCITIVEQRMRERDNTFDERFKNSRKIIKWLNENHNNGFRLVERAFSETNKQYNNLPRDYLDLFRRDIGNCLGWLQGSLEQLRNCEYNSQELASAMAGVGFAPYEFALNKIKEELKGVAGETDDRGVVGDYVSRLIKLLSPTQ